MASKCYPETNIFAPENGVPLEVWRFLLETTIFRGELLVVGSVLFCFIATNMQVYRSRARSFFNTHWNPEHQKIGNDPISTGFFSDFFHWTVSTTWLIVIKSSYLQKRLEDSPDLFSPKSAPKRWWSKPGGSSKSRPFRSIIFNWDPTRFCR